MLTPINDDMIYEIVINQDINNIFIWLKKNYSYY